jgi:hypothetical protein
MTISTKQAKELHLQGQHELSAELYLRGYQLTGFCITAGIDFFVSQPETKVLRAIHVETSAAHSNGSGSVGTFTLSKRLVEEKSGFELWFAFVLVLGENVQFVVVPQEEMLRFLVRQEKRQPLEGNTLRFQLFLNESGGVSSRGQSFTPFLGLQHLFLPVNIAA